MLGLGSTVSEIDVSTAAVFPKTKFSMVIPEVEDFLTRMKHIQSVVLFGIEVINVMYLYLYCVLFAVGFVL